MRYNQIKAAQPDKQAGEFQTYVFPPSPLSLWATAIYCYIKNDFKAVFHVVAVVYLFFNFKGST